MTTTPRPALSRRQFLTTGSGIAATAVAASAVGTMTSSPAVARQPAGSEAWQSQLLRTTGNGRLVYPRRDGHRLPDFGHAGYHHGERELPDVPVVHTIGPVAGDNTAHLQAAFDHLGTLAPAANGFRGALLLTAGTYEIAGTVQQRHSGVVVRGVGDGADPATNTILRPVGEPGDSRSVVLLGGDANAEEVPGTQTDIVTDVVHVGDDAFTVADASGLEVGMIILVTHPCTQAWLEAVDGGGVVDDAPWDVGSTPIVCSRRITGIQGNRITVDVALFTTLDRSLSQCYVARRELADLATEVGVEDLRIDVAHDGDQDTEVAQAGHTLRVRTVQDAWVQRCTMLHFSRSGIITKDADRVTVRDCRSLAPVSEIKGSRRYNFQVERRSQQVLFTDCDATDSRHAFVVNGMSTTSGIVFHRTTATGSHNSSESHRQWAQGLLYDNHREIDPIAPGPIALHNRGDFGTAHGWSAVHSVAWNTDAAGHQLLVQRPPTAQNYAIGCFGEVNGDGSFPGPVGHIEGTDRPGLQPESLYEAQLADRLRDS